MNRPAAPRRKALPALLSAMLSVLAAGGQAAAPDTTPAAAADAAAAAKELDHFPWPTLRMSGSLSAEMRRDHSTGTEQSQRSTAATLTTVANTYLWEPWFARVDGTLSLTLTGDSSTVRDSVGSNILTKGRSVAATGSLNFSLLPATAFPFDAHFDHSDSRAATDKPLAAGTTATRLALTQRYTYEGGSVGAGWDHATTTNPQSGTDRLDHLQLNMSHTLDEHRIAINGDASRNVHVISGESSNQRTLVVQHGFEPTETVSFDNVFNTAYSDYRLLQSDGKTNITQLSSLAMWRPEDWDMVVSGGVRLFAFDTNAKSRSASGHEVRNQSRSVNANVGATYAFSEAARLSAGINANVINSAPQRRTALLESASFTYQPPPRNLERWRYSWYGSANASNSAGEGSSARLAGGQISHNLSRQIKLSGESLVVLEGSQGLSSSLQSSAAQARQFTRQLSHSVSIGWSTSAPPDTFSVRASMSDSRSLNDPLFVQMANLQTSFSMQAGAYSSLVGNLTVQAARQHDGLSSLPVSEPGAQPAALGTTFTPSSSASVMFSHGRVLGVRNLRFSSDLRISGQSLLPAMSKGEHETAAWESHIDYAIGRIRLRLNALVARSTSVYSNSTVTPISNGAAPPPLAPVAPITKVNRLITFSVSRGFGS